MAAPHPARAVRGASRVSTKDPLLQSFYDLFVRSYRQAEKQKPGAGVAVYKSCAAYVFRLCMQPWAQRTIFLKEARAMKKFLADTGIRHPDANACLALGLMAHMWGAAWTNGVLRMQRQAFHRVCRVSGVEHFLKLRKSGQGVMLAHSHTMYTQLFWRWLEHEGIDLGVTLCEWTWSRKQHEIEDPKIQVTESAREMRAAVQTLKQGGIAHALADGGFGGGKDIEIDFFGRRRPFRTTFADLALTAKAAILTADTYLEQDGSIVIDIGPPLNSNHPKLNRNQLIEQLVRDFAAHLQQQWQRSPGTLPWKQMGQHLRYPRA